jgi:hypothetical protein
MKYLLPMMFLLMGCGGVNGTQHITQDGESFTYVIIRLEFIEQIRQMCQDSILLTDYPTEILWKQEVAKCTFKNLSLVNINPTQGNDFVAKYCQPGSDLSGYSPTEVINIKSACSALGY